MKRFTKNITNKGRLVRGIAALLLLAAAGVACTRSLWMGGALGLAGAFVLFEAIRGWCLLRACGIKTRM